MLDKIPRKFKLLGIAYKLLHFSVKMSAQYEIGSVVNVVLQLTNL